MAEIKVAVKGLLVHNSKLLLVQRSQNDTVGAGTWETVGGNLAFGESFEKALQREFLEEVGLAVHVKELLYASTFLTSSTRQIVLLAYLCETACTDVTLSSEHEQYVWATKEQALQLLPNAIIEDFNQHHIFERLL